MRTNRPLDARQTHEGSRACGLSPLAELRRTLLACLLWEDTFYEDGESVADRIAKLAKSVAPSDLAALAVEARRKQNIRHAPLWLVRNLAALHRGDSLVADTVAEVVRRPDDATELLSLLTLDREGAKKLGRIPKGIQRGIARAFNRWDAYQLAKYANRPGAIQLRDALFLCHPKPTDDAQAEAWKALASGTLSPPDTWEVALSRGDAKRETWERLLREQRLGGLALLRNLRNMIEAGAEAGLVKNALASHPFSGVLPFRFIAAARHAPSMEPDIEAAFLRVLAGAPRLPGRTAVVVDHSGSMGAALSQRSDMLRFDAACGLAMILREMCDEVRVFAFSDWVVEVPARRGFGLRDAIHGAGTFHGTYLEQAVSAVNAIGYDRIVVVTDEQSHDGIADPLAGARAYVMNVGTYRNGIGYGRWTNISGWSEHVVRFIVETETA